MTAAWKTVRVFISSTFRDMHAERDHLVKVTFPRLRQWCAERRLHLIDIDLRWGVTREQADNGKAIDVCLQEIDGSRPFFVCLLGNRYGWVADQLPPDEVYNFHGLQAVTHLSITHLEILHATQEALPRRDGARPPACAEAFFYFRRPECLPPPETLPAAHRDEYRRTFFEESVERRDQLTALQQALRERYQGQDRIFDYGGGWDPEADNPEDDRLRGRLTRLEALGERVEADLRRAIEEVFVAHLAGLAQQDPLAEELSLHDTFIENRTHVHVPRTEIEDQLSRYVEGSDPRPLVLSGPPGSGKSAVLAHWVRRRQQAETEGGGVVLARFIGASPASASLHHLLATLCRELVARFNLMDPVTRQPRAVPEDPAELRTQWPQFLQEAGRHGRVLLVLDALDQLDRSAHPQRLDWLAGPLPENVRLVVSVLDQGDRSLPGEAGDWLASLRRLGFPEVRMAELTDADRRRIIRELPSVFCKTLDESQAALLLANQATRNPLFLTVALEELRVFGSFEKLRQAILALPRVEDASTPGAIDEALDHLFERVLERLERETARQAPDLSPTLFRFLASAREGLSEEELRDLLDRKLTAIPAAERDGTLQVVLRQVRPYLVRKGLRRGVLLDFYHRSLRKAVRSRYLSEPGMRESCHRDLAAYFAEQPYHREAGTERLPNERKLAELAWQWRAAALSAPADPSEDERQQRWQPLEQLLAEPAFLEAKAEAGMVFELVSEYAEALTELPAGSPRRPLLGLLEEALRADVHFIARHPASLFQCLWNRGWWYDCPQAVAHYELPPGNTTALPPWQRPGPRLSDLLQAWRRERWAGANARPWLCALRPPLEPLGGPQRAVLRGHGNVVFGVAFSADGRYLASGSWDNTARLWETASGQEVACLHGHDGAVEGVAFSPDGTRLATAGADNTVRVWETAGGSESLCLRGHEGWVMAVAWSPDGRHVASASWDGSVRVWDAATGTARACLRGADVLYCVAFTPDGGRLLTGDRQGGIQLWDWQRGQAGVCLPSQQGEVRGLALSADGRRLVSGGRDGTVRLWDLAEGRQLARLAGHKGTVYSVALAADGRRLASSSWDRTVRLWDAVSGASLAVLTGHAEDVSSVALSADGRRVASGSWDWTVRLWDAERAATALTLRDHGDTVTRVVFAPDGRYLASASFDRSVRLWDAASGALRQVLRGHTGLVSSLAFARDGSRLASGSFDGTVRVWDTDGGRELACLTGHSRAVLAVSLSGDGTRACSGSWDRTVRVWDVKGGKPLGCGSGHQDRVTAVALAPDGGRVVSGSRDRTVRVWDAGSGKELLCCRGHDRGVLAVGFLPDLRRIYSVSWDRTVRLWDLEQGTCLEVVSEGWQPWVGGAAEPIRAVRRGTELAVVGGDEQPLAWFPVTPRQAAVHPDGRTWAVPLHWHVSLFTLVLPPSQQDE